jgi:hypothetical protein
VGDGAVNEGIGIAAIHYAFEDGDYSIAETVYGTKNWYRDLEGDPDYPLGDFSGIDAEMTEFLEAIDDRDASQFQWQDPEALKSDYENYWEQYTRAVKVVDENGNESWDDSAWWGTYVDQATNDMLANR